MVEDKKYNEAVSLLVEVSNVKDSKELVKKYYPKTNFFDKISAGDSHTVGLKSDGTVVAVVKIMMENVMYLNGIYFDISKEQLNL